MEDATLILRFIYSVYAIAALVVMFAIWLSRMSWTLKSHDKKFKDDDAWKKETGIKIHEMDTRRQLTEQTLTQLVEGQKELAKDIKALISKLN